MNWRVEPGPNGDWLVVDGREIIASCASEEKARLVVERPMTVGDLRSAAGRIRNNSTPNSSRHVAVTRFIDALDDIEGDHD